MTISIRRILCPTDFSEFAEHAMEHAAAIARAWSARLVTLHVMPQTLTHPEILPFLDTPLVPEPEIEGRARARLESFAAGADCAGGVAEHRLIAGDPRTRIVAEAGKVSADLIVLGTHGRGGFVRFLLGSVAERVVRNAARPVLTVSAAPRPSSGTTLPYPRILAAVDFSTASNLALEHALAFRRKAEGDLLLVHVVEPWSPLVEDSARKRLEEALASRPGEPEAVEIIVESGQRADREVQRLATERGVDLVVVGATGEGNPGPCEPGFLGSTVHALLRSASCPVLTVRPRTNAHPKEED